MQGSSSPHSRRRVRSSGVRSSMGWLSGVALVVLAGTRAAQDSCPDVPELLRQVQQKLGSNPKKAEALVAKVEKAVGEALAAGACPGAPGAPPRPMSAHPGLTRAADLAAAVKAEPKKCSAYAKDCLARHPWGTTLELVAGLEYGSDRPVPAHENGFIELGALPEETCTSELVANTYLFGLREIVGWRAGVVAGKKAPTFRGRTPKDAPPALETGLAPRDALRVYLEGSTPDVPLFALPRFTHVVHARLAERRGAGAPMDELFALLDSRWNGFTFQARGEKAPTAVALPVFSLIADRQGFVQRFPTGERLTASGDVPFVSVLTLRRYAEVVRHETIDPVDLISLTPEAKAATDAFWRDCTYLARYRGLIELFARSVLAPSQPLPRALAYLDFPSGTDAPAAEAPRALALLVWAAVGEDPLALADWLHEHVLAAPENAFPGEASLPVAFTQYARAHEGELRAAVAKRAAEERGRAGATGDYERAFAGACGAGGPATAELAAAFRAFHEPLEECIHGAALAVVQAELER